MEEGKLEDEGFGEDASRTPLVGWAYPACREKSEEIDENSKTPLSHGAVWPAGISKVQPLTPLDLGPGWYQLDKLIGSDSLIGPAARSVYEDALAAGHAVEAEATPKQKR